MTKHKSLKSLIPALMICGIALSGCSPVGVAVATGAAAGTAAQKEQGFEQALVDTKIDAEINGILFQNDADLFGRTGVSVVEGVVMLTGLVSTVEARDNAGRLSWKADDVVEVINEIQIAANSDLQTTANDTWITTQLKTILLTDDRISSINYSVATVRGTVYLLGLARDDEELQRVIDHARSLNYVKNVINHVRLFSDPRRKANRAG